jgi:hypothetical protein
VKDPAKGTAPHAAIGTTLTFRSPVIIVMMSGQTPHPKGSCHTFHNRRGRFHFPPPAAKKGVMSVHSYTLPTARTVETRAKDIHESLKRKSSLGKSTASNGLERVTRFCKIATSAHSAITHPVILIEAIA